MLPSANTSGFYMTQNASDQRPNSYAKLNEKRVVAHMIGEWIPVTERLPELDKRVLLGNAADQWVCFGSRQITGEHHHWDGDDYEELNDPTHWMPEPPAPSQGE